MHLSNRITTLTADGADGWEVFYKARQMIADGVAITELTIGEHDIRTAAPILQDMHRSALGGHTGYAMVPGTDALRDIVAARTQERTGVPTTRANVLITPGGQSALFAAHAAACDPGDVALYIDPYYATYPGTIRAVGAIARAVAAQAEDGFQPRGAEIAAAARDAKSLLINTPNNPTGVVYAEKTLTSVAEACVNHDLWLISDEVYDTQVWDGAHLSPRALPGMADRTLVVGSMSKSHAMTGSRVGWVIGPEDVIAHLTNLATHTTYGVPGYIQDAALFALNLGDDFEIEIAAPFKRRRDAVVARLARQNVITAQPSGGTMYLMLNIRNTGLSSVDFAFGLLDAERVAVMPGESFGSAAHGHIRLALTQEDDVLLAAIDRLLAFANEQQRQK